MTNPDDDLKKELAIRAQIIILSSFSLGLQLAFPLQVAITIAQARFECSTQLITWSKYLLKLFSLY